MVHLWQSYQIYEHEIKTSFSIKYWEGVSRKQMQYFLVISKRSPDLSTPNSRMQYQVTDVPQFTVPPHTMPLLLPGLIFPNTSSGLTPLFSLTVKFYLPQVGGKSFAVPHIECVVERGEG